MAQRDLSDWEIVQEQVKLSKIKRLPYKDLLGDTLTNIVTQYHLKGLSAQVIIDSILERLRPSLTDEGFLLAKKNVYISVYARFAEQNTLIRRLR